MPSSAAREGTPMAPLLAAPLYPIESLLTAQEVNCPSPENGQPPVFARLRTRRQPATPASPVPQLSIVIVNYCQWEDTAQLVEELVIGSPLREGTVEIVIVDNHSEPHVKVGWLRRQQGVSLRRW